jgi:hypothetical protein
VTGPWGWGGLEREAREEVGIMGKVRDAGTRAYGKARDARSQ